MRERVNFPQSTRSFPARYGFTFAELVVVLAMLIILLGIFIPYLAQVREQDRRARCADNLRTIGAALTEYAQRNNALLPQTGADPHHLAGFSAFSGADSPNPFARDTHVQPNDVTASLWLLMRAGMAAPEQFVCPSTNDTPDPLLSFGRRMIVEKRSNFSGRDHLSYSYSCPFSAAPNFHLTSDKPPEFAVMADRNPGNAQDNTDVTADAIDRDPLQLARINSLNHARAGQNVLFADHHVEFKPTPYCGFGQGWRHDNIYTVLSRTPLPPDASPQPDAPGFFGRDLGSAWRNDSYLVPGEGG